MNSTTVRTMFIVSRQHFELYSYLRERFAGDSSVDVILDRRRAASDQRQLTERRQRPEVEIELTTRSHAILTLPATDVAV
jgi:hypothetical protein